MSTAEFRERKEEFAYKKEMLHSLGSIRYCKAELFKECILGTIRLPQKNEQKKAQLSFGFYLTGRKVFFVEDEGKMKAWIEKQTEMFQEVDTPKQLLLRIMEHMIEEDTLYFSHMESELDKLEEKISGGTGSNNNFFTSLIKHRQKLSEFNIYYEQLIDIAELFSTCDFINLNRIHKAGIDLCTVWNNCKIMYIFFVKMCSRYVNCINQCRMHIKIKLWL